MWVRSAVACGVLILASSAHAQDGEHGKHGVGVRIGTGGIGVEYSHRLGERFDLRGGYAFGSLSRSEDVDDIEYDIDYQFGALFGMLDLRPFGGAFRVSVGGYSKAPSVDFFTVADNDDYQIGNSRYTANGRLDGDVDLGSFAPFAGIGWGGTTDGEGFGLSFDAGVMFAAEPDVTLAAAGRACNSSVAPCDPDSQLTGFDVNSSDPRAVQFREALDQERQNFERDIESRRYWPVVSVGLHYRF